MPESEPSLATTTAALSYYQISAGYDHTCGVTTDERAFCWGAGFAGALGDGTRTDHRNPVRVVGGLSFRQVSAGVSRSCGVTTSDRAYCWGNNFQGQLGDVPPPPMKRRFR